MIKLWNLFWYGSYHSHTIEIIKEIKDYSHGTSGRPSSIILVSRCTICGEITQIRIK